MTVMENLLSKGPQNIPGKLYWKFHQGTRKLVKALLILQVSSWGLGGQGCSWWSWGWCQVTQNILAKINWKFYQDQSSGSLSRLHLSSKSLPGVLVERDVLDGAGDGVIVLKISQGSFTESFIKIQHLEACQDPTYPPSLSLESWRKGMFLMELEMVSWSSKYPREASLKVTSRSIIRKLVKTTPIIKVSSWSLGGHGGSWWTWRWCREV